MNDTTYITEFYNNYDEEGRLTSENHSKVEYITTMTYLKKYLKDGMNILEVGAGTGRYSIELAHQGYRVHSLELVDGNLDILKSKILPHYDITAQQGNALDLSRYEDESFDITLVLGPMYHLYNDTDKIRALNEAARVTKKGGIVFVAYCMNEPTVLQYCFEKNKIHDCLDKNMLTEDFRCISTPQDIFELVRVEDIARLRSQVKLEHIQLIATDGHTHYMRPVINEMDEKTFKIYMKYHLATCQRQDLIGASHHVLDILKK